MGFNEDFTQPTAQLFPTQGQSFILPPARNPMELINPMYTRQAPQNSLAPMVMYQAYKQTGQMPAETSSFQPFTPAAPASGPMASAIQSAISQPGMGSK